MPWCREALEEAGHVERFHPQNTPLCVCRRPEGLFSRSKECNHRAEEILLMQTFTHNHKQPLLLVSVATHQL